MTKYEICFEIKRKEANLLVSDLNVCIARATDNDRVDTATQLMNLKCSILADIKKMS